jgi:hypothetical protein
LLQYAQYLFPLYFIFPIVGLHCKRVLTVLFKFRSQRRWFKRYFATATIGIATFSSKSSVLLTTKMSKCD